MFLVWLVVSRYMSSPKKSHWYAMRILRYLCGTLEVCLEFGWSSNSLVGYVYSDYAGDFDFDFDRRRSLTGYVFTLEGSVVS